MTDDSTRVELHLDRDPRLISAVRSAVHFLATRAGLEEKGCESFAQASEEVCREALTQITDDEGGLNVTLEAFPDRMEISIHHRGRLAPVVGLETFAPSGAEASGGLNGVELRSCVDRVSFNAEKGIARTTLVKYVRGKQ
jgi:anti-sigma regulatory factor (Ser/Thr protein kinase)